MQVTRSTKKNGLQFLQYYYENYGNTVKYFNPKSIHEIIKEDCLRANDLESKILILYCHNENDDFGKTICESWLNDDTVQKFCSNDKVVVTGYNITSEACRNDLIKEMANTTEDNSVFENFFSSVRLGDSKIYIFIPHCKRILCQDYIDSNYTLHEFQHALSIIIRENTEKLRNMHYERNFNKENLTCQKFQQIMFKKRTTKDFDTYLKNEHEQLKNNIRFAYFGPPPENTGDPTYKKQMKWIEKAFKAILTQSDKHACDEGVVSISMIHICCVEFTKHNKQVSIKYEKYKPFPVFILRKCHAFKEFSQNSEYCRVIIDSNLRVYSSWKNFMNENKYPKCILCTPTDGKYQCDGNGDVLLKYHLSPTCGAGYELLDDLNKVVPVVSVSAVGLTIAAIFAPVVLPVAVLGGAFAASYITGRDVVNLIDRNNHDEDLSLSDSESRVAYISILAASVGLLGAGATSIIGYMALNGMEVGETFIVSIDVLSKANIALGGLAVGNSLYDIVYTYMVDGKRPPARVMAQLSALILYFCFSLYNYRGAQKMISEAQTCAKVKYTFWDYIELFRTINMIYKSANPFQETTTQLIFKCFLPSTLKKIVELVNKVIVNKVFTTATTPCKLQIGTLNLNSFITPFVVAFVYRKGLAFLKINVGCLDPAVRIPFQCVVQYFFTGRAVTGILVSECTEFLLSKLMNVIFEQFEATKTKKIKITRSQTKCHLCAGYYYCQSTQETLAIT